MYGTPRTTLLLRTTSKAAIETIESKPITYAQVAARSSPRNPELVKSQNLEAARKKQLEKSKGRMQKPEVILTARNASENMKKQLESR